MNPTNNDPRPTLTELDDCINAINELLERDFNEEPISEDEIERLRTELRKRIIEYNATDALEMLADFVIEAKREPEKFFAIKRRWWKQFRLYFRGRKGDPAELWRFDMIDGEFCHKGEPFSLRGEKLRGLLKALIDASKQDTSLSDKEICDCELVKTGDSTKAAVRTAISRLRAKLRKALGKGGHIRREQDAYRLINKRIR